MTVADDTKFLKRLRACVERGVMSTSDAAHWFDIAYQTMWAWLHGTRATGSRGSYAKRFEELEPLLIQLEQHIKQNGAFRIPFSYSRKNSKRGQYIRNLRDGKVAPLSSSHSTE